MVVPSCTHELAKKHGHDRHGNPRMRCKVCGKSWTQQQPKLLGDSRLPVDRAVMVLRLLLEGTSIRATARLTNTDKESIINLMMGIGERCNRFLAARVRNVPVSEVECDELWGFVAMKEKTRVANARSLEFGDCYTYVAMERNTKMVLAYHHDKRSSDGTFWFINKLKDATSGRFQVSTDGYRPYQVAIPLTFKFAIDYSQVIKTFGGVDSEAGRRYSPAQIIKTQITHGCGNPDLSRACTSHSERLNLSIRMQVRRMTRLTNGHSKKWENHEAMLALYFCWYNFARRHESLKTTPAVAQGLTDHAWSIEEMLAEVARY